MKNRCVVAGKENCRRSATAKQTRPDDPGFGATAGLYAQARRLAGSDAGARARTRFGAEWREWKPDAALSARVAELVIEKYSQKSYNEKR